MNHSLLKYQKPLIIGWIITTLTILGYHAIRFNQFFEPAYSNFSPITVSVDVNQRKLDAYKLSEAQKNQIYKHIHNLITKITTATEATDRPFSKTSASIAAKVTPTLPVLSGILQTQTVQGDSISYAILDGRQTKTRERISGFTIRKIGPEGVVVTRDGQRWFIPLPAIPFSYQQ